MMKTIKQLARTYTKENRFKILAYAAAFSAVSTGISLVFNSLNLAIIGVLISSVIVFLYFVKINEITARIARGKKLDKQNFLSKPEITKKHGIGFSLYVALGLIVFIGLYFGTQIPSIIILLMLLIAVLFAYVTGVIAMYFEFEETGKNALINAFKEGWKEKKLLFHYLFRMLTIIIQGAILTLCLNVFVFGPQIQKALETYSSDSPEVLQYFTNLPATFIQTAGVQVAMFYSVFIGFLIYKTYVFQRKLPKRRKK